MSGLFDDLIPEESKPKEPSTGLFDDLIPDSPAAASESPVAAPDAVADTLPQEEVAVTSGEDTLSRIGRGITEMTGIAASGIVRMATKGRPTGGIGGAISAGLQMFGQDKAIQDFSKEVREQAKLTYPIDPKYDKAFSTNVIQAAVSLAPVLISGPAAPLTAAALAGEASREEAVAAGASEADADLTFALNAPVGAIMEQVAGLPALLKSAKAAGLTPSTFINLVKSVAIQAGKGFIREGTQESVEQTVQNTVAKYVSKYDKERGTFDGVKEAAFFGGLIGAPVAAITQAASSYDAKRAVNITKANELQKSANTARPLAPETAAATDAIVADLQRELSPEEAAIAVGATAEGALDETPLGVAEEPLAADTPVVEETPTTGIVEQQEAIPNELESTPDSITQPLPPADTPPAESVETLPVESRTDGSDANVQEAVAEEPAVADAVGGDESAANSEQSVTEVVEPAVNERDASKPEQMTPEEWSQATEIQRTAAQEALPNVPVTASNFQYYAVSEAIGNRVPVSSALYDQYKSDWGPQAKALPEGYVKQGELYVYQPDAKPSPVSGPSLLNPDGSILAQGRIGQTHNDIMAEYNAANPDSADAMLATRGFVDEAGNALSRKDAASRGVLTGQLPQGTPEEAQSEDFNAAAKIEGVTNANQAGEIRTDSTVGGVRQAEPPVADNLADEEAGAILGVDPIRSTPEERLAALEVRAGKLAETYIGALPAKFKVVLKFDPSQPTETSLTGSEVAINLNIPDRLTEYADAPLSSLMDVSDVTVNEEIIHAIDASLDVQYAEASGMGPRAYRIQRSADIVSSIAANINAAKSKNPKLAVRLEGAVVSSWNLYDTKGTNQKSSAGEVLSGLTNGEATASFVSELTRQLVQLKRGTETTETFTESILGKLTEFLKTTRNHLRQALRLSKKQELSSLLTERVNEIDTILESIKNPDAPLSESKQAATDRRTLLLNRRPLADRLNAAKTTNENLSLTDDEVVLLNEQTEAATDALAKELDIRDPNDPFYTEIKNQFEQRARNYIKANGKDAYFQNVGTEGGFSYTSATSSVRSDVTRVEEWKQRRVPSLDQPLAEGEVSTLDTLSEEETQRKSADLSIIKEASNSLPPRQQQVVDFSMRGFTPAEIAEEMGLTLDEVENEYDAAVEFLKGSLGPGAASAYERLASYKELSFTKRVAAEFDPFVQENVQRYYEEISNAQTAEDAVEVMKNLTDEDADKLIRDTSNNMAPRIRTAIGSVLMKRLKAKAAAAKETDQDAYYRALDANVDLFNWLSDWGKELGQGVQAFAMWDGLGADGVYRKVKRDVEKVRDSFIEGVKDKIKTLRDDINNGDVADIESVATKPRDIKARAVKEAAKRGLRQQSIQDASVDIAKRINDTTGLDESKSIWEQYQDIFAARFAAALGKGTEKVKPAALQLFTSRLTKNLLGFVPAQERAAITPDKLQATIEDALNNKDRYAEAFQAAIREVSESDPSGANAHFFKSIAPLIKTFPISPKTIASFVNQKAKDVDLSLSKAFTEWYKADRRTRGDLETIVARTLTEDVNVSPEDAATLAAVVTSDFKQKAEARRVEAVRRLSLPKEKVTKEQKTKLARLFELTNMGAVTDQDAYSAIAERQGLPDFDPAFSREIYEDAQKIQEMPEGRGRNLATMEFVKKIAAKKGFDVSDFASSFIYANILSSPDTSLVNTLDTATNIFSNAFMDFVASGGKDTARLKGILEGYKKGLTEAKHVLKTGERISVPGLEEVAPSLLEIARFGVKDGVPLRSRNATSKIVKAILENKYASFLNGAKYVGRALEAQDALNFSASREGQRYSMAARTARSEGLAGQAAETRMNEILNNTDAAYQAALTQAAAEGYTGKDAAFRAIELTEEGISDEIKDASFRRGLNDAYRQEMKGWAGSAGQAFLNWTNDKTPLARNILRMGISPFVRTPVNVFNRWLDYSPFGYVRLFAGTGRGTSLFNKDGKFFIPPPEIGSQEFYVQAAKATSSVAVMGMVGSLVAAGLATIEGAGPPDEDERKIWQDDGNIPYSIRFGKGPALSFKYTPWAVALAAMANYENWKKYNKGEEKPAWERALVAMSLAPLVVKELPFFKGPSDLIKVIEDSGRGRGVEAMKKFVNGKTNMLSPVAAKWMDALFDPKQYNDESVKGLLLDSMPFARKQGNVVVNIFGEPVNGNKTVLQQAAKRFVGFPQPSPQSLILSKFDAFPSMEKPNKAYTVDVKGDRIPMTPEQYQRFVVGTGQQFKAYLLREFKPDAAYSKPDTEFYKNQISNKYAEFKQEWRGKVAE